MDKYIGGINLDAIRQLVDEAPDINSAGASIATKFALSICDLVRARRTKGEQGHVSIFLCSKSISSDVVGHSATERALLGSGKQSIQKCAWLTTANLGTAFELHGIDVSKPDSIIQQISGNGFSDFPAIIIDWRDPQPLVRFYPKGVSDVDALIDLFLDELAIDMSTLRACLDHFFETTLKTPMLISAGHGQKIWKNANKGIPVDRPEEKIQGRLMDHLKAKFSMHKVRAEQDTEAGRFDLLISRHIDDPKAGKLVKNEWLLELKALCDQTSGGVPVKGQAKFLAAMDSGVDQAVQYREALNAEQAALCCYDMRSSDVGHKNCFKNVASKASSGVVHLFRWYMFRSSAAMRKASTAAAS